MSPAEWIRALGDRDPSVPIALGAIALDIEPLPAQAAQPWTSRLAWSGAAFPIDHAL